MPLKDEFWNDLAEDLSQLLYLRKDRNPWLLSCMPDALVDQIPNRCTYYKADILNIVLCTRDLIPDSGSWYITRLVQCAIDNANGQAVKALQTKLNEIKKYRPDVVSPMPKDFKAFMESDERAQDMIISHVRDLQNRLEYYIFDLGEPKDHRLVLAGQAKTGKTRLLKAIEAENTALSIPIFIDFQNISTKNVTIFAYDIALTVYIAVHKWAIAQGRILAAKKPDWKQWNAASDPVKGNAVSNIKEQRAALDLMNQYWSVLFGDPVTERVPAVLMMDEVEWLVDLPDDKPERKAIIDFFTEFVRSSNSWLVNRGRTFHLPYFLLVGSEHITCTRHADFNWLIQESKAKFHIPYVEEWQSRRFWKHIEQCFQPPQTLALLHELSDGQIWVLESFFDAMMEIAHTRGIEGLDEDGICSVIEQALNNNQEIFEAFWNRLDGDEQQTLLALVSLWERDLTKPKLPNGTAFSIAELPPRDEIKRGAEHLMEREWLAATADVLVYRVKLGIMVVWICQNLYRLAP